MTLKIEPTPCITCGVRPAYHPGGPCVECNAKSDATRREIVNRREGMDIVRVAVLEERLRILGIIAQFGNEDTAGELVLRIVGEQKANGQY